MADRDRREDRRERREDQRERREDRRDRREDRREDRRRYTGPIRANRRVIERRPIYVNNGRFVFHNGVTRVYNRPVISRRYYDRRFRPTVVVENYPAQHGYIWVGGSWGWGGSEWVWTGGHYAADPSFSVYYDDGSWE
jgi:hypothetical protein